MTDFSETIQRLPEYVIPTLKRDQMEAESLLQEWKTLRDKAAALANKWQCDTVCLEDMDDAAHQYVQMLGDAIKWSYRSEYGPR